MLSSHTNISQWGVKGGISFCLKAAILFFYILYINLRAESEVVIIAKTEGQKVEHTFYNGEVSVLVLVVLDSFEGK